MKGPLWLPARGGGVDVHSNGSDEGSDQDCASGTSTVNGNVAGEEWQCVELVNRLFLTKGWISATWPGSAGQPFYDQAPSNLTKEPEGFVSYLGPGDVVDINEYLDGNFIGGHVLIVDDSSHVTSGTVWAVSQNSGDTTDATPQKQVTIGGGNVTVSGEEADTATRPWV